MKYVMVDIENIFESKFFNNKKHKDSLNPHLYYLNTRAKVTATRNVNVLVSSVEQMISNFDTIKLDIEKCIEHIEQSHDYFYGISFIDELFSSDKFSEIEFIAMKLEFVISGTKSGVSTPSLNVTERGLSRALMLYGKNAILVSSQFKVTTRAFITALNKQAKKIKVAMGEIESLSDDHKLVNSPTAEGSEEIMQRRIARERAFWVDVGSRCKK